MLSSLRRFSESEIAEKRLKIINFYERFGEKATYEAFSCKRGTIHVWKKRLEKSQGRIYHNPSYSYKKANRKTKLRTRYAPKPEDLGYIEMDTIILFVDRIRYHIYSAIDVRGKFAFSLLYKNLNSRNTVDFFKKFQIVYPVKITTIQTDNGLEFLGEFEQHLEKDTIPHVFIYPRCCRINGVVERYQRTLQDQFVYNNLDIIHNPTLFNKNLLEYLIFYNTQRVHKSIEKKTPIDYLLLTGSMSKMSVTYTTN